MGSEANYVLTLRDDSAATASDTANPDFPPEVGGRLSALPASSAGDSGRKCHPAACAIDVQMPFLQLELRDVGGPFNLIIAASEISLYVGLAQMERGRLGDGGGHTYLCSYRNYFNICLIGIFKTSLFKHATKECPSAAELVHSAE